MMLLLRVISRLIGMVWMVVLALVGLGVAMYCFDGFISLGSVRPDRLLHLPNVRRHVGRFLHQIALSGPTAALALLGGVAAIAIGLLLLAGMFRSLREGLVVLDRDGDGGTVGARTATLGAMCRALAEQAPGVTAIKRPRVKSSRRGTHGRLKITASRARTSDGSELEQAIRKRLEPISDPFGLRPRVRLRVGERGERVQ
jgi:hypothetical protein